MKEKQKSINQEKQQYMNRTFIFNLIREKGICSRAELARVSGLKRATITNIINEFIQADIVKEEGVLVGHKGRRSVGVRIHGERYKVLGITISRKSYSIAVLGINNTVYKIRKFSIEKGTSVSGVIESIKNSAKQMIQEETEGSILAIGGTVAGPYQQKNGKLVFMTYSVGFDGLDIWHELQKDFEIPIFIENDANAGAIAVQWEYVKEFGCLEENLIYVIAGEGIGCGIISKGELLRGASNTAGELGHCSINFEGPLCECGNRGCLELYCSLGAFMGAIKKRIIEGEKSVLPEIFAYEELKEAVLKRDRIVMEEYRKAARFMAVGIINLINQINPGCIIIGDKMADLDKKFFMEVIRESVEKAVRKDIRENLKLLSSNMKPNPILAGAGIVAIEHIAEEPFAFVKGK